eukprot:766608-Rhodomonas_salina.2
MQLHTTVPDTGCVRAGQHAVVCTPGKRSRASHRKPTSVAQSASHPSPAARLPSSQASPASSTPSPQRAVARTSSSKTPSSTAPRIHAGHPRAVI